VPDRTRRFSVRKSPYIAARNSAIRDVVLPRAGDFHWLLSIDNDVDVTDPGVGNFLATSGDLVSCRCEMDNLDAFAAPDAFHTPFWFCRIDVLRAVSPPWFWMPYSKDGCDLLTCDCAWFAAKVREAGFTIAHGGWCGHERRHSWTAPA
jgi:hypothetical protein